MNNGRDCPHGRQVGKCDTCDVITAELELQKVSAELKECGEQNATLAAHIKQLEECLEQRKSVCRQAFDANDAMKAERDALTAQVEALRSEIQTPYVCRFSREEKLSAILAATPQQHLVERDAQKGRDGFIAGVEARRIALLNDEQVAIKANQYADSIRQEKK